MNRRLLVFAVIVLLAAAVALLVGRQSRGPREFTEAVRRAEKIVLFEGLPHPFFEGQLLEAERRTKAVQDLHGYPFYQEPLQLTEDDGKRLTGELGEPTTYRPFSGEKRCGGFHPDDAVEWRLGTDRYRALLCFGCQEVKIFGPGIDSRHDLDSKAHRKLSDLLKGYRQNRPSPEKPR